MPAKLLFGIAMAVLILGMLFAVFTLFKTGREFSGIITNRSSQWDLHYLESDKGLFALKKVSYSSLNKANCSSSAMLPVNIEFILRPKSLTRNCELYVDYKFVKEIATSLYECPSCSSTDYVAVAVSTNPLDPTVRHTIEICCDDACIEKVMLAIC